MTKPKVLISDALSPAAVQIFKDRGVEVDVKPGLSKDELLAALGQNARLSQDDDVIKLKKALGI